MERDSVRRETNAVSGATIMSVPNQHQNPLHLLSHQHREVEVRREKRNLKSRSPSGKTNRQPCRDVLKGTCLMLPCDNWHPSECQFKKSESGCEVGDKCSFRHRKVEEQPNKKPNKGGDTIAVVFVKGVTKVLGQIR